MDSYRGKWTKESKVEAKFTLSRVWKHGCQDISPAVLATSEPSLQSFDEEVINS